ncbi:uncharacterized protein BDR25DRAFT_274917 [Lindgomyces ingoldianus]|uniref:Uncharacterized protein n=1 Tax=Lindgomyces ingoldianus TaxID=673940 RepID=A0ACB6REB9_9PLEO|nr:uncharacterized protein BDR25DRAFT_274917 [Lindgomyces ingoldianus]KAF2477628.1 hypothetical protein BDR25DRAFT_274917 [Lindgomyces ingoldianus]
MDNTRKGPFKLVTVNTAPERAKKLIGRMIEELKDQYWIQYLANCETIEEVGPAVQMHQPNILFSASMWSTEQAEQIRKVAERERPGIRTHAIPQGLQDKNGPDAIVAHLVDNVPPLLDSVQL